MKEKRVARQIAMLFIGSIVGAGLSSGRELNQFFGVYGYKSLVGLFICAVAYVWVGTMIIDISVKYKTKSYNELVEVVCPKWIGAFTNITLTLFLVSSTSIIFAGSSAVIHQYFGVPKWIGFLCMLGCSVLFLMRHTKGLFEVNNFVVPFLLVTMTCIFFGAVHKQSEVLTISYLQSLPYKKGSYLPSTIIYAGFNIISIIGVITPITQEIKDKQAIKRGILLGTIGLTIMSCFITFLMIINPTYPKQYEIPILAVASQVGKMFQIGLLMVIWLEMFSSQISNIYSLTRCLETQFHLSYQKGMWLVILIAIPFAKFGFSNLVEVLYPIYGLLSLLFVGCVIYFYMRQKICIVLRKKIGMR